MNNYYTEEKYRIISPHFREWRKTLKVGDKFLLPFVESINNFVVYTNNYFWISYNINRDSYLEDKLPFITPLITGISSCSCIAKEDHGCVGAISFKLFINGTPNNIYYNQCLGYDTNIHLTLPLKCSKTLIFRNKL